MTRSADLKLLERGEKQKTIAHGRICSSKSVPSHLPNWNKAPIFAWATADWKKKKKKKRPAAGGNDKEHRSENLNENGVDDDGHYH